ncbi:ABC transporter permease [Streptococcus cuniculi]|uniref:ABC transporter permease n=1 Tax=Streptococcus cuniculi TaxID=1432788 RepID=A0A4Y9JAS3_9STRE|nr:ABC transporter permease [Streptococcus cuniculi]MBF0778824.1 ABC transporter permease [Streptococcus cuniculi]TFU97206.1 ABC transporter permease [Streptococcus cuniculi]
MFGKLLKYEFKAVGKWYLGLYAAAGLLSIIIGLWLQNLIQRPEAPLSDYDRGYQVGTTLANTIEGVVLTAIIIGFAIVIAGLFLSTLFLIINRFRKNVYGRQGYLTMTLPVNSHQIILSKLTTGFVWSLLSGITTILCLSILFFIAFAPTLNENLGEVMRALNKAYQELTMLAEMNLGLYYIISLIVGTVNSILLIYFAISLGQLFKDHRTLLAVVFYFAINFVEGILSFVLLASMGGYVGAPMPAYSILTIILSLLLSVGYYFGTYYIMTNKLNLQ